MSKTASHGSSGALSVSMEDINGRSSWIRRMFEVGNQMRAQIGADKVFDFTIGNPTAEPPAGFLAALRHCADDTVTTGTHRYMSNQGFQGTRRAVAAMVASVEEGMAPSEDHVVMTCGAAGAISSFFKAVLDEGDEVIVLLPFFGEYEFYISNRGCKMVNVATTPDFDIDVGAIKAALTAKTRAVLICSPNNPTGRVYGHESIARLGEALRDHTKAVGRPVYLINDAVYGRLIFDAAYRRSNLLASYENAVVCGSFSKDMSLAGERVGYICLNPLSPNSPELYAALGTVQRVLGYVNAPAIMQRALAECIDAIDVEYYRSRVHTVHEIITKAGMECVAPQGAFFLFPRVPGGLDDLEFVDDLAKHGILAVPGRGFGMKGYIRLSCALDLDTINRSAPVWAKAVQQFKDKKNSENPHNHC